PARQVKTAAEGRNPPSKTIGIRLPCRHLKIDDSAHAAAGVMQTFPSGLQEQIRFLRWAVAQIISREPCSSLGRSYLIAGVRA
ncbi:hypothetical protein, partial [Hydrogenophaga sp.]